MSLEGVERKAVDTGANGVYPPRTPAQQVGEVGATVGAGQDDLAVDVGRDLAFAGMDDADPRPFVDLGGSGNSLWLMTTVSVVSDMAPDRTCGDPARNRSTVGQDGDAGMTALYLFCAAVGIPLLLWFSLAGDADGGDGFGDADADGPLAFLSLSTLSFVLGFFGLTGLLLDIVGTAGLLTLLVAIITAIAAGAFNSAAFRWLRRNSNSARSWTTNSRA